ncbi:hypothetical protein [Streptomyces sp. MNU77]|uniref:hypothetical protein n=1 Tax=Streptomyces sp. MNU77 TaxID=1573406 RepID=UPI00117BFCC0|nr:hypothetical protein [Streptomyces sp. MNU77]
MGVVTLAAAADSLTERKPWGRARQPLLKRVVITVIRAILIGGNVPKSRSGRVQRSRKRRAQDRDPRREVRRRLAAPRREPRPRHPDYGKMCPAAVLFDEFGEDGADWLQDEYERPLTIPEFKLERGIRWDEFLMDDPFTGPRAETAETISRVIVMTSDIILTLAENQNVLSAEQAREVAEMRALPPVDHASEGFDIVREAFAVGAIFLNDRDMWEFGENEL